MRQADIVIAGAGIAGLSLALKLRMAGRSVLVLERNEPGAGASRAAAGMLAVHDPANPPELLELAERSIALYPRFLAELQENGAKPVPFETEWTLERSGDAASQAVPISTILPALSPQAGRFSVHRERSLDPRKLFTSLLTAVKHSGVNLLTNSSSKHMEESGSVRVTLDNGDQISCGDFVDCTGAWSTSHARPVKGQMLRLQLSGSTLHLEGMGNVVVRTPEVYLVPRLDGTCVVGATVEDAGFDTEVRQDATDWLRGRAAAIVPAIASAREVETWCGLRPGTANGLPVLGALSEHCFVANGLYRNGILLAPVVAELLCALVQGQQPALTLSAFQPRLHGTASQAASQFDAGIGQLQ